MGECTNENFVEELGITSEDVKDLADLALFALTFGVLGYARIIIDGLKVLRPESEAVAFLSGIFWLRMNEPENALKALRSGPPTDMIRIQTGLVHMRSGDLEEATAIFSEVKNETANPKMAEIAEFNLTQCSEKVKNHLIEFLSPSAAKPGKHGVH